MAETVVGPWGGFDAGDQGIFDAEGNVQPGAPPTESEMAYSYVAPGVEALLPIGIAYHAPLWVTADGLGRHAREQVKALAMTGLPIRTISMGFDLRLADELPPEVQELDYLGRVTLKNTALSIKHCVFNSLTFVRNLICPAALKSAANEKLLADNTIIYTSWERDRVSAEMAAELNKVAKLWVPCQANKDAFVMSGVDEARVDVIPYPFNPAKCDIAAPRGSDKAPGGRRFYNIGKWEPRKNQHKMLGAFLQAFSPKDKVSLFIKTSGFRESWTNYPNPDESVQFWLQHASVKDRWSEESFRRCVRIISEKISEEDIRLTHQKNNIYVSPSCGEAWDIPAFDAKLAGNRLMHVGFGGSEEYAEPGDEQIPYTLGPVHPGYGWEPDAKWADVRTDTMAGAFQRVQPPTVRRVPSNYVRRFGYAAVGRKMEESILSCVSEACLEQLLKTGGYG